MKEKRKQEKGITLIALVITIIVLLILAGVTLSIVMNTGIVDNSKKAVNTYNAQQAKDKLAMALYNYRIAQYMNSEKSLEDLIAEIGGDAVYNDETGEYEVYVDGYDFTVSKDLEITSEDITGGDAKPQYTVTIQSGEGIVSTNTGRKVTEGKSMTIKAELADGYVFEKWKITNGKGEIKEETSITTIITPSENLIVEAIATAGKMNNKSGSTNNYTFTGKEKSYNNPVIPAGFVAVQTKDAKWKSTDGKTVDDWNKGLVIADAESGGNEFVWVPVDGTDVPYEKWYGGEKNKEDITVNDAENLADDTISIDENMQINEYNGFYIARYEAGIPADLSTALKPSETLENTREAMAKIRSVEGKPVSQKNQVPWNCISYTNAKKNAELMYTSTYVKSGLLTGKMWDATMKWLQNSGVDVSKDSSGWGNYNITSVTGITQYSRFDNFKTGINWETTEEITRPTSGSSQSDYTWLLKTGNTDYTKRKNIYDLAGNLWEWTTEKIKDTDSNYIPRGASLYSVGVQFPACTRYYLLGSNFVNADLGFRVALYLESENM